MAADGRRLKPREVVGVVDQLGAGVEGFAPGEQVSINPNLYCGHCDYCRAGRLVLCENFRGYGSTIPGFFAEYTIAPAAQVFSTEGLPLAAIKGCVPVDGDTYDVPAILTEIFEHNERRWT